MTIEMSAVTNVFIFQVKMSGCMADSHILFANSLAAWVINVGEVHCVGGVWKKISVLSHARNLLCFCLKGTNYSEG